MPLNMIFDGIGTTPDAARGISLDVTGTALPAPSTSPAESTGGTATGRTTSGAQVDGRWITCDERAGVIEIRDPRLFRRGREAFCRSMVEAAVSCCGAVRAAVSIEKATCRLEFVPGRLGRAEMSRRVATAIRTATPAVRERSGGRDAGGERRLSPAPATDARGAATRAADGEDRARRRRLKHAAMAGGSLAAAAGAVILPGLPTLPFLIMTGRHAALASPRIERLLRHNPWVAARLDEVEESGGPTIDWRSLLGMIAVAACFAAGIYLFQPSLPVVLLLELGLMLFLGLFDWLKSALPELGGVLAIA